MRSIKSLSDWFHNFPVGPKLPISCSGPSMVTSPDGQGVILLGCYPPSEQSSLMFQLRKNNNGILSWNEMPQKLKYPRTFSVAMLLPDYLVQCT